MEGITLGVFVLCALSTGSAIFFFVYVSDERKKRLSLTNKLAATTGVGTPACRMHIPRPSRVLSTLSTLEVERVLPPRVRARWSLLLADLGKAHALRAIALALIASGIIAFPLGLIVHLLWLPAVVVIGLAAVIDSILVSRRRTQLSLRRHAGIAFLERIAELLGAGKTLSQACETAALESPEVLAVFCDTLLGNLSRGLSPDRAFYEATSRAPFPEMRSLGAALAVQYRAGGDMKVLFADFAAQLRTSLRHNLSLKSQTAQARLSVKVVALLPPLLIVAMNMLMPGYLGGFLARPMGRILVAVAVVLDVIGLLLVKKIMHVSEEVA